MLRTVEWCKIAGFEPWWRRLAREATEDVVYGGFEGISGAFWLFAMCRSDDALGLIPKALDHALVQIAVPRVPGQLPWRATPGGNVSHASNNIAYASAIVFAERRLQHPTDLAEKA